MSDKKRKPYKMNPDFWWCYDKKKSREIPLASKDFQIVIPTHNRPTKQITLMDLPESIRKDVLVVTSTQKDADIIRKKYKHERVYAINDDRINSIALKRHWIMVNVASRKIVQLDDDMNFFIRCATKYREYLGGMWKIKKEFLGKIKFMYSTGRKERHYQITYDKVSELLDEYAHVCISSRMGNDKVEHELKIVGRAMHALGYNRDVYIDEEIRFDEIRMREDFNVTLRFLTKGYPNAIIQFGVYGPKPYGGDGGCSDERTVETSDEDAIILSKMYPGLVSVRDKEYYGRTAVVRKETTIYWQKAYQSYWKNKED